MSSVNPAPEHGYNDEIDLFELAQGLWKQKSLIVIITLAVTLCAAGYAFLSAPVYESKSSILPPRLSDVAALNLGRADAGIGLLDVGTVYGSFIQNLRSESVRRSFFEQAYLPVANAEQPENKSKDEFRAAFGKTLSISVPDEKKNPSRYEIKIEAKTPERAAQWVTLYEQMAAQKTLDDIAGNVTKEVDQLTRSIQGRIDVIRNAAVKIRTDRIAQLQEALTIASVAGISNPQVKATRTSASGELQQFIDGNLDYMRGATAIKAELEILQNRKNDDPFIPDLRNLENQLIYLAKVNLRPAGVAVYTKDSIAEVPETPIKPKKALIIALGLVLGGMLGVFVALIRTSLLNRKQRVAGGAA